MNETVQQLTWRDEDTKAWLERFLDQLDYQIAVAPFDITPAEKAAIRANVEAQLTDVVDKLSSQDEHEHVWRAVFRAPVPVHSMVEWRVCVCGCEEQVSRAGD